MQVARVKRKCVWGKLKGEVPLNSVFVCLFLINFELTVHTYSLEYAVDNLLCWMLVFFTPIDFISSGCSSVIQLLKICPRSQVHFQGAQLFFFFFCSNQLLLMQIINIQAASSFNL